MICYDWILFIQVPRFEKSHHKYTPFAPQILSRNFDLAFCRIFESILVITSELALSGFERIVMQL